MRSGTGFPGRREDEEGNIPESLVEAWDQARYLVAVD